MTVKDTTPNTNANDLHRIIRQTRQRRWAFYDRHSGELVAAHSGNQVVKGSAYAPLAHLLHYCINHGTGEKIRTLYITGGRTASDIPGHDAQDDRALERYWTAPLASGWSISSWSREPMHVQYVRGGNAVDILMGSTWYGEEHAALRCAHAHTLLGTMLRHEFDAHAVLMNTPGRTGADLLQRSLPKGRSYPALPDAMRHVLSHEFGQGRMEQPGFYRAGSCPGVYVSDARLMYATACRHLPTTPAVYDRRTPVYHGYRKAVYRIATRVPDDWEHIGLVPQWSVAEQRTVFPRKPGQYLEDAWLTGAELAVLYEAGWPVNLKESIVYAPEDAPGGDPARAWVTSLRGVLDWASINEDALVRAGGRKVLINTVGYWHRSNRVGIRWAAHGQESMVPRDALMVLALKEGTRYTVREPLDAATDCLYRPEWAVQVWGACRAKLNRQALQVQPRHILWLRHDSLVLDYDPGWPDSGKPGEWRTKWSYQRECEAPLTEDSYRQLMRAAYESEQVQ